MKTNRKPKKKKKDLKEKKKYLLLIAESRDQGILVAPKTSTPDWSLPTP